MTSYLFHPYYSAILLVQKYPYHIHVRHRHFLVYTRPIPQLWNFQHLPWLRLGMDYFLELHILIFVLILIS